MSKLFQILLSYLLALSGVGLNLSGNTLLNFQNFNPSTQTGSIEIGEFDPHSPIGGETGVELLVQAKPHWMDSLAQVDIDKMSEEEKRSYEARTQIGDIIVVRPAGWQWGKEESLPNYVVIRIVGLKLEDAKKFEESLMENNVSENPRLIRLRQYAIPKEIIENAKRQKSNSISITQSEKDIFISNIFIKTGNPKEVIAPSRNSFVSYWRKIQPRLSALFQRYGIRNVYAATQLKKTVMPSGGDYTSLEACMNANEQDLVAADKYFDVEIDGDWTSADTTAVTIHNYTTDATRYINIYTQSGDARHNGIFPGEAGSNAKAYALVASANPLVSIANGYVKLQFLCLRNTITDSYRNGINANNGGSIQINNCIIDGNGGTTTGKTGIYTDGAVAGDVLIYDNIIYDWYGGGINIDNYHITSGNIRIYNNTIVNSAGDGIYWKNNDADVNKYLVNNLIQDCNTCYDLNLSGGTISQLTNLSSDTSSPNNNYDSKDITFADAINSNYHLAATDTDAIDDGTDLGDGVFDTDIDDRDRDIEGDIWDIGADEYVATGATNAILKNSTIKNAIIR